MGERKSPLRDKFVKTQQRRKTRCSGRTLGKVILGVESLCAEISTVERRMGGFTSPQFKGRKEEGRKPQPGTHGQKPKKKTSQR